MYMEHMFTRRKTADVSALSSYGSCETENKRCGSCILTTKLVTRTNYYDKMMCRTFFRPNLSNKNKRLWRKESTLTSFFLTKRNWVTFPLSFLCSNHKRDDDGDGSFRLFLTSDDLRTFSFTVSDIFWSQVSLKIIRELSYKTVCPKKTKFELN